MSEHLWQPSASLEHLRERARIIQTIRQFFIVRNFLEVETPSLAHHTVTDPYIESIRAQYHQGEAIQTLYLQTSPEYHMKRLLASGSGDIFQFAKTFRDDEQGRLHNPEFTLLEWYRLGFDHHQLMDEMDELLQSILHTQAAQRLSYHDAFDTFLQLNPKEATIDELKQYAYQQSLNPPDLQNDKDAWLIFLFSQVIEPKLQALTFIYDYPATQAALARLNADDPTIASRFEVYYRGIELANGFHELILVLEQSQRFAQDIKKRQETQASVPPIDEHFLAALRHGLPDCAGVALGIDRLVMLALGAACIDDVIAFSWLNT